MRDGPLNGPEEVPSTFHILLQRLASEHDRELGHLRAEVAHLRDRPSQEEVTERQERELEELRKEVLQLQQVVRQQQSLNNAHRSATARSRSKEVSPNLATSCRAESPLEAASKLDQPRNAGFFENGRVGANGSESSFAAQRGRSPSRAEPLGSSEVHQAPIPMGVKKSDSPVRMHARGGSASLAPEVPVTFSLDHMAQGLEWEEALEHSRQAQVLGSTAAAALRVQSACSRSCTPATHGVVARSMSPTPQQWVPLGSSRGLCQRQPSPLAHTRTVTQCGSLPVPITAVTASPAASVGCAATPLASSPAISTRLSSHGGTPVVSMRSPPWQAQHNGFQYQPLTGSLRVPVESVGYVQTGSLRAPVGGSYQFPPATNSRAPPDRATTGTACDFTL